MVCNDIFPLDPQICSENVQFNINHVNILLKYNGEYVFYKDKKCRYLYANESYAMLLGCSNPEALYGKTDNEIFPDQAVSINVEEKHLLFTHEPIEDTTIDVKSDNVKTKKLSFTKIPFFNNNGDVMGIVGVGKGVLGEGNRDDKNEILANIARDAPVIMAFHDKDHKIKWANNAYEQATGKTLEQIKGKTCYEVWGLSKLCDNCPVLRAIQTDKPQEFEITSENQNHWSEMQGSWLSKAVPVKDQNDNIIGVIETALDITEKKKVERQLRESVDTFKTIFQQIPILTGLLSTDGTLLKANKTALKMIDRTQQEVSGKKFYNLAWWTHDENLQKWLKKAIQKASEGDHVSREVTHTDADGDTKIIDFGIHPIKEKSGRIINLLPVGHDITELRKAEKEKKNLARFPEEDPNPVLRISSQGRILYANQIAKALLKEKQINQGDYLPEKYKHFFSEVFREGAIHEKEYTILGKTFLFSVVPINEAEYINVYGRDISSRKKAEQSLRKSEYALAEAQRLGQIGSWEWNMQTGEARWSSELYVIYGLNPENFTPRITSFTQYVHPDDRAMINHVIKQMVSSEEPVNVQFRIIRPDGTTRILDAVGEITDVDEQGKPLRIVGTNQDITERKQAEKILMESEKKYRLLAENSVDCIWTLDKRLRFTYLSPALERITCFKPEEWIGTKLRNHFSRKEFLRIGVIVAKALKYYKDFKPVTFETKILDKNNQEIDVEITGDVLLDSKGKLMGLQGATREISERKEAQRKIRESEKKYRTYIDNAPYGVFITDEHGRYLEINNASVNITGYSKDELLSMTISDIIAPEYQAIALIHFKRVKKTGYSSGDNCFIHKNGEKRWWRVDSVQLSENRFLGFTQDITEKKTAEIALKESEEKYRNIVDMAPDGIVTMDMKGFITSVNRAFLSLSGFSKEEIEGKHFTKLPTIFKSDIKAYAPIIKTLLLGGKSKTINFKWKKKNGEQRLGQAKMSVMKTDGKRKAIQGIVRDITEEKKAEEELKQAHKKLQDVNKNLEDIVDERTDRIQQLLKQKDEFINQMGHDLKNPLGPFIQLLPILKKHAHDQNDKQMIEVLNRNAWYMKNLVNKTIELAKLNSSKISFNFEPEKLVDIVEEVINVNITLFDNQHIKVENKVSCDLIVQIDRLRVEEVLTNLFNNAVKYTDGPGQIIIDAKLKDERIVVSVKDNGIGISKDQINRLFDEYYKADTSRHDFDSSGLGLPICKRIIEKHGGKIWAESKGIGKGSTFYFTLPMVTEE